MSRELLVRVRCDVCSEDEEEARPAEEVRLAFGSAGVRSLDFCEEHMSEYVTPLRDLWLNVGRKQAAGSSNGSLPKLLSAGTTTRKRREPEPEPEHDSYVVAPLPDGSWQCPECGKICHSAGGLGAHRRSHGIVGSSPGMRWYYENRAATD